MVTSMPAVFRVKLFVADRFDLSLAPVPTHGSLRVNVLVLCLFRIALDLAIEVCHAFCQRPIHELASRL